ncbi:Fungalysin metallopeptidase-domain-containing protein [Gongronella butleri]|nr:Fungalysin metallopeptidase-domain-containing protein [Gongronella butleri]
MASLASHARPEDVALAFARDKLTQSDFVVDSQFKSDLTGITHVHLRQIVHGKPVLNGNININVLPNGRVLSYGNSFARPQKPAQSLFKQVLSPSEAVVSLYKFVKRKLPNPAMADVLSADALVARTDLTGHDATVLVDGVPFALQPVRVKEAYLQQADGSLALVWDVQMELDDNWYSAQVDVTNGAMLGLVDWVHQYDFNRGAAADDDTPKTAPVDAYYNVIPFGNNDPSDTTQQLIKNPHDPFASPEGWHSQGHYSSIRSAAKHPVFNVTAGNNVYAHTNPDGGYNWEDNYRPQGHSGGKFGDALVFDYEAKFDIDEPEEYEDAAVTNLFYWCNMAHDLFHRYGFDEKSGNFQHDNLGRGRANDDGDGDAVIANAQDGSGRNNANFATPPDGQHGKMRMYVWDQTKPMRDGDFESGIVLHEYTHGVSNRLTGGYKNSNCLGWGEAGGMGEGWGDFVSTIVRMKATDRRTKDYSMGAWANGGDGIRKYHYSTNMKTNPSTYNIMDRFDYWGVHAKGEVWAEMLYEVYWNLVDKHGFTEEWFPPTSFLTSTNTRGVPIMTQDDVKLTKEYIVSHGNTLALQLVLDGMKLQPCSPSFTDARDAILDADKALTGGANYCDIYNAFAKRGLGFGAKLAREGWLEKRKESYDVPPACQ